MNTLPDTLLSTIQNSKADDVLASRVTHPFAISAESTCNLLEEIITATGQVANSLNGYLSTNFTNQKLVSLLRQQAALYHSLHLSEQNVQQTIDALRKRPTINYGEDIPPDRQALANWCVSCLERWGKEVGMEVFRDEREAGISLVLGGKVLVIDIDLSIDATEATVQVSIVKTSYAISSDPSTPSGSSSLDAFLKATFQNFFSEVQKPEDLCDPVEAARLGKVILDDLHYLVMLDKLAERKVDGGVRWFVDVDQLCSVVENFSKSEAQCISTSLGVSRPPLDIFLHRAHALPLPYLNFPSLSFLVYLSPLAYLNALRTIPESGPVDPSNPLPQFDVSLTKLRSFLTARSKGATICTLILTPPMNTYLFVDSMSMPEMTIRPTFPLAEGATLEHVFPKFAGISTSVLGDTMGETPEELLGKNIWTLDFTGNGQYRGVVMSQSRMREIELVINPLSNEGLDQVGMMSFGSGSWVDLLLNPSNPISPERYTTLYQSPTLGHPPLQLRLTAPEEPGFILEKVPVTCMKEAWGILEVVREQCWLNETLLSCRWTPEGLPSNTEDELQETEATEEVLQAVLNGTLTPRKIPVNVFIPSGSPEPLFDDAMKMRRPRIIMTCPERPPISGLVAITVSYDETRPKGISVEVSGAMGADLRADTLAEICRRGGTFGLPGRVWAKASEM